MKEELVMPCPHCIYISQPTSLYTLSLTPVKSMGRCIVYELKCIDVNYLH